MKKLLFFILCLAFIQPVSSALASGAEQRLNQFYRQVTSMRADFTQSIISETRPNAEKSQGVLEMQRPGKFRWNYSAPYEQQIVADGKRLYIYDVEMEQVIVKPLDLALGNTPAVLLSGGANITDKFEVEEITENRESDKSLFWLQLLPRDKDAGFEKLLLAFAGDHIKIMELKDAFGQVTRLTFSNMKLNPDIDPSVFEFKAPPGVDVINETQNGTN
ncbi:MAG: outer membrane lipoprotein chaperone LolA [Gammaproteobacteria bacterium]|jgi:outer membrane lipoprotein carrier protein